MLRLFKKSTIEEEKSEMQKIQSAINKKQIEYEKLEMIYNQKVDELNNLPELSVMKSKLDKERAELNQRISEVQDLADELGEEKLLIKRKLREIEGKEKILQEKENNYLIKTI